jgi:hypothetical protein
MQDDANRNKLVGISAPPNATADLTLRGICNDEEFAIYLMRLAGVLAPEEIPHPLDLANAVSVTRDEWFVERALQALEQFYDRAAQGATERKLVVIPGGRGRY